MPSFYKPPYCSMREPSAAFLSFSCKFSFSLWKNTILYKEKVYMSGHTTRSLTGFTALSLPNGVMIWRIR